MTILNIFNTIIYGTYIYIDNVYTSNIHIYKKIDIQKN